jgi:sulfur carrier protein ThiS
MNIQRVDVGHIHQVWPLVEEYLVAALEHAKEDYTLESVKVLLVTGQWVLIVAVDGDVVKGAAAVSFTSRPHDRVAFVTLIGGKLISNDDTFEQLKNLLRALGATCIEGAARESIARLWSRYGFEEKYRIVGVKI